MFYRTDENVNWAGDQVSYNALHSWIHRNKPKPLVCECCGKEKKLEAANISGEYKRDIEDWEWLCRKCHMDKDGRNNALAKHNDKRKVTDEHRKEMIRLDAAKRRRDNPEKIKEIKQRYYDKHLRKKQKNG